MSVFAYKLDILHKSGKTVFSTADLALAWNIENKNVLRVGIARAKRAEYLAEIRRGVYHIKGVTVEVLELAGKLKKNSYISFETVLAREGLVHQWYDTIFSASDRKSYIRNAYGIFSYRRLPEDILNNRRGIVNNGTYFIATKERAVCDYFYAIGYTHLDAVEGLDRAIMQDIAALYRNKRLEADIKKLFV